MFLSFSSALLFFKLCIALYCPHLLNAILTWFPFISSHISLFFHSHFFHSTVCIKRRVIHHKVKAECSPRCTPVCRLLVCQPHRAWINHPVLRHWNYQGGSDRDRRERERDTRTDKVTGKEKGWRWDWEALGGLNKHFLQNAKQILCNIQCPPCDSQCDLNCRRHHECTDETTFWLDFSVTSVLLSFFFADALVCSSNWPHKHNLWVWA